MTARAQRHDPSVTGGSERIVEPDSEREVPEVVGCELKLPAVSGQGELRQGHHPGVVDQQVQRSTPAGGELGGRRLVGEIEPPDVHGAAGARGYVFRGPLTGLGVANGERHLRAGAGQGSCGLDTDAR